MHAAFKAGVHDVQILIRQGHVADHIGLDLPDEGAQLGYIVRVHLSGGNLDAKARLGRSAQWHRSGKGCGLPALPLKIRLP
jgi:hypothetical protein